MAITFRDGISIAELIFYLPSLAISVFLGVRHGFGRSAGWYYLIFLALVRIVGSAFQLATIADPTDSTLYTGTFILQSISISPLELASFALISKVLTAMQADGTAPVTPRVPRLAQLLVTAGLALGVVGGINSINGEPSDSGAPAGSATTNTLSKVSVALYIIAFLALLYLLFVTWSRSSSGSSTSDRRILLAIAAASPFLLVRIVYSALSSFTTNKTFNMISGNEIVLLCMCVIEEWVVVVLYAGVGMTLTKDEHRHAPIGYNPGVDLDDESAQYQYMKSHGQR